MRVESLPFPLGLGSPTTLCPRVTWTGACRQMALRLSAVLLQGGSSDWTTDPQASLRWRSSCGAVFLWLCALVLVLGYTWRCPSLEGAVSVEHVLSLRDGRCAAHVRGRGTRGHRGGRGWLWRCPRRRRGGHDGPCNGRQRQGGGLGCRVDLLHWYTLNARCIYIAFSFGFHRYHGQRDDDYGDGNDHRQHPIS